MKIIKNFRLFLAALMSSVLINLFISSSVCAKTESFVDNSSNNSWQFYIAPYGWLASLSADTTVKRTSKHMLIPFSEILKHLDFSGEAHIEANHGPWTIMLDPTYLKVSDSSASRAIQVGPLKRVVLGPIKINVTSQTLLIDGGIFYQFCTTQISPNQVISFEGLGAGRYLGLRNKLVLGFSRPDLFSGISLTGNTDVIAPIIGARIKDDDDKWHFWLRGDVGGFNIDHVKETWSATAGLAYDIHTHVELGLAYRVLKIEVIKSSNLAFNALMYGPMLGIAFKF